MQASTSGRGSRPSARGGRAFWVHAALAVSAEGLRAPLGLLSMMPFVRKAGPARRSKPHWRERFRDPDKLSRRWPASVTAARTRVGAARRAIHLMDREGDSYELLATLTTHGDRFVVRLHYGSGGSCPTGRPRPPAGFVRSCRGRTCGSSARWRCRRAASARSGRRCSPGSRRRDGRVATVRFAARSVVLQRPRDHRAPLPVTLAVNVVYAWEVSPPVGEPPVEWWLVTTEPGRDRRANTASGGLVPHPVAHRRVLQVLENRLCLREAATREPRHGACGPRVTRPHRLAAVTPAALGTRSPGRARTGRTHGAADPRAARGGRQRQAPPTADNPRGVARGGPPRRPSPTKRGARLAGARARDAEAPPHGSRLGSRRASPRM